ELCYQLSFFFSVPILSVKIIVFTNNCSVFVVNCNRGLSFSVKTTFFIAISFTITSVVFVFGDNASITKVVYDPMFLVNGWSFWFHYIIWPFKAFDKIRVVYHG